MLNESPICAVLPATDLERAKKFYLETLGLKQADYNDPGGIMFEAGLGSKVFIYERPAVKVEHTQASFSVSDLLKEMDELRSRGVVFEEYDFPGLKTENGVATFGTSKAAWFKDSEGNIIALNRD